MPKGQKLISWDAENEIKLLYAILAVHDIKIDYPKVAAIFGPDIPASCISQHMCRLRKKIAASIGGTQSAPSTANHVRRSALRSRNATPGKKERGRDAQRKAKLNDGFSDDDLMDTSNDTEQEATPPDTDDGGAFCTPKAKGQSIISGRVTKARASPRKAGKKNYKALVDPFPNLDDATDGEGGKMFGTDKSDNEDSCASDGEFALEKVITNEEVVV